jgi:hypothetical protein
VGVHVGGNFRNVAVDVGIAKVDGNVGTRNRFKLDLGLVKMTNTTMANVSHKTITATVRIFQADGFIFY